jgi:predicted nucleic acid-binding protein
MVSTVLLDTNVFTAWLKPRSTLVPLYGRHVFGRRVAIAQQTVAEARYGAVVAGWGDKRVESLERLIHRSRVLPMDDDTTWAYAKLRFECRRLGRALSQKQHVGDLWIAASAIRWQLPLVAHDAVSLAARALICALSSPTPAADRAMSGAGNWPGTAPDRTRRRPGTPALSRPVPAHARPDHGPTVERVFTESAADRGLLAIGERGCRNGR